MGESRKKKALTKERMSLRCLRVQRTEVCTIGQGLHVGIADSLEDEPLPAGSAPCIPGSALCYLLDVIGAPPSPLKLSQDIVTCLLGAKSPQVRTCYKKKPVREVLSRPELS